MVDIEELRRKLEAAQHGGGEITFALSLHRVLPDLLTELEQLRAEKAAGKFWPPQSGPIQRAIERDLREELTSLRQAAAAHVAALGAYIDYKNLEHDDPCPEDDTCECEYVLAVDASLRRLASELEGKGT